MTIGGSTGRGAMRWSARRWTVVLLAMFLAACGGDGDQGQQDPAAGDSAPASAAATDALADGELVDVGGRSLFVKCVGSSEDGPTILLEAGLTGDSLTWEKVVPSLPPDVRTCSYDRANLGRSDPAPTPRTAQDVVDDLDALLDAIDAQPPYVLVGFSFGGILSQLYAAEHPEDVSGLVLVESNHPDEVRQFEQHLTRAQIAADRDYTQSNPEGIDIYTSFDQVREAGSLPQVPLVVVTATISDGWPPGWDAKLFNRLRAQQQADLADQVPGGQQIFAKGSGHDVPADRPDVVVDAINQALP